MIELSSSQPRSINIEKILFVRWMAIHGRLGRIPEGKPEGELIQPITAKLGRTAIDRLILPRTLRETIEQTGDY